MVHEKVLSFLKMNGPSLPVDVAKAIGYNSFLTKAVLGELINKGLIKKSHRPIGGSLIYFVPEHVNRMRELLKSDLSIPERQVLNKLSSIGRVLMSSLTPHDRAFINKLIDFISVERRGDDYLITYYDYKPQSVVKPEPPVITPVNSELRLFENSPKVKSVVKNDFESRVRDYLNIIGEVISFKKIKVNSEYDFIIKVSKPFVQELFVKAKSKKSINETDLSVVYTEALRLKKPALLLTTGSISKRAVKWKKDNVGSLVNVIKLK